MRKNFFDLKLSQFSKYLNDIGILTSSDTEQFQKQFYENSFDIYNANDSSSNDSHVNFIYFKESISNALVYFIKSLSEEKLKLIALNIFTKYNIEQDIKKDKLLKILKIYSYKKLKTYFHKWKSDNIDLTKSLKRTISSNILNKISNLKIPFSLNHNLNLNENNITNDNINVNTNNNFYKNNLKTNNSMANLNSQNLNISTYPDNYNNNNNNFSCYENSIGDNTSNNFTNEKKYKIHLKELNNTYSTNYYNPSTIKYNYFNHNSSNYSDNYNKNYISKTIYKQKYTNSYSNYNNYNNNSKYNTSTYKSKDSNLSSIKVKNKVNIQYLNNLSKSKTEHNLIPEKTTQYLKEQEELNNYCTFKPKINKSSSFSRYPNMSNKKSIDRLYLDSKNRMARKELQTLKKTNLESKENTFMPKFISSSVKKIKSDFSQRLKEFESNKRNKIKKISKDLEDEQKQQYTFSPKINEPLNNNKRNNTNVSIISKNSSQNQSIISKRKKIPAYKRLYEENKNKQIRQEERVKQEMNKIKRNSSMISEGNNNKLDLRKIEELYNDYKSKKNRLKIKQSQIEKEQGITFRPELISEKKYYDKINPNFYEREKQFLEKQQRNIEISKQLLKNGENKNRKTYSEEEKKEIYSNIVNRLYKDGVEKYMQKKNSISITDNLNNNNSNIVNEQNLNLGNENDLSNNKNNTRKELELEQEPEEEIFRPKFGNIGLNNDYYQMIENNYFKNININQLPDY